MSKPRRTIRPWTPACSATLQRLAQDGMNANQIAKRMQRAPALIRTHAAMDGVAIARMRPLPPWSPERDQLIRDHYPDMQTRELAALLGTSLAAVYGRANALGVHKSDAFNASPRSGRIRPGEQGATLQGTRFQPGHATWNKGRKGTTGLHPNCVKHHFRPGELTGAARYNYVPVGSEHVRPSANLRMRKVTDDPAVSAPSRWRPVHTLVWEAAHGPIPEGHVCVFKAGQRTTRAGQITLDRLELVTRAELMSRNSVHRYPAEVVDLFHSHGQLVRRLNYATKQIAKASSK